MLTKATMKTTAQPKHKIEEALLAPERAMELLENNKINRPMRERHLQRITNQITEGLWQFNGDTIKISSSGDVVDGQHRLWAIIAAKRAVPTIIVWGVDKQAFSTIDTIRAPRSGGDVLSLQGVTYGRGDIATALAWLLRWQRGIIPTWRDPRNRIENSDIEAAFAEHSNIQESYKAVVILRPLVGASIMAFLDYIVAGRDQNLAERMIETLRDPSEVSVEDPFFRFRSYLAQTHHMRKNPVMTIALAIKAINAAWHGQRIKVLQWRGQGKQPEDFPVLEVK